MSTTPQQPPRPTGQSASSDPAARPSGPSGPTGSGSTGGRPSRGNPWVWPLVALVVGLAIGALAMNLARSGGGSGATASPTPTPATAVTGSPTSAATATGTATAIATGTVPAECLEVADDSQKLVALANQAVQAARDLNASQLSDLVRQIGESQQTLTNHADTCRAARATLTTAPPVSTSATSPSPSSTSNPS
jgi:hypothetical protein